MWSSEMEVERMGEVLLERKKEAGTSPRLHSIFLWLPVATDSLVPLFVYNLHSRLLDWYADWVWRVSSYHTTQRRSSNELDSSLAKMATTITTTSQRRITKLELGVCAFRNNLFNTKCIRYSGPQPGRCTHYSNARSVKRNFHLSLLYCHLDGRQQIVLLVLCFHSTARHPRMHWRPIGIRVFVVSAAYDASINFRVNMENKLHIICIQWTIVVANSQWIKWQSHRIRQPQNLLCADASRCQTNFWPCNGHTAYTYAGRQLRLDSERTMIYLIWILPSK